MGSSFELVPQVESIEQEYINRCNISGDITEHLPILRRYALDCEHITEMGIRKAVSTWALLDGRPKKFIGYDINYEPIIETVAIICEKEGIEFIFKHEEVSTVIIEQTDLLFIDTWHVYEQLKRELEQHHNRVNKYIILHDTEIYRFKNEKDFAYWNPPLVKSIVDPVGLWPAVEEFLEIHPEWKVKEHFTNNNGLTVLERKEI